MALQRTEEWHEKRRGKMTASRMHRLMNGGERAINTLLDVLERELDEGPGGWTEGSGVEVSSMDWGTKNEPKAISLYEMIYGEEVEEVGLVEYEPFDFIGASPDGIVVGKDKSLEVKCPYNDTNHQRAIVYGIPKDHYWQMQTQSLCIGNSGVDFVSYDPRERPRRRLYVQFQMANQADQARIVEKCEWLKDLLDRGERLNKNPKEVPTFF